MKKNCFKIARNGSQRHPMRERREGEGEEGEKIRNELRLPILSGIFENSFLALGPAGLPIL